MKNKTVATETLTALVNALENKRVTASAAAKAAKDCKEIAASLGLESGDSYTLRDSARTVCVVALYTERPVAAIAARIDSFFSYKEA